MNRNDYIFVIDFITSGQTPGKLLAEKKIKEAKLVMNYIRTGPPNKLALTDPVLFVKLRNAITMLMLKGYI